jgi:hypothetical protein
VCDLPAEPRADLVGRAEVDSRIILRIDDLLEAGLR